LKTYFGLAFTVYEFFNFTFYFCVECDAAQLQSYVHCDIGILRIPYDDDSDDDGDYDDDDDVDVGVL